MTFQASTGNILYTICQACESYTFEVLGLLKECLAVVYIVATWKLALILGYTIL